MLAAQMEAGAKPPDADVHDEYGLRGGEENAGLAARVNKMALRAFNVGNNEPGIVENMAGRQIRGKPVELPAIWIASGAQRGETRAFRPPIRLPTKPAPPR